MITDKDLKQIICPNILISPETDMLKKKQQITTHFHLLWNALLSLCKFLIWCCVEDSFQFESLYIDQWAWPRSNEARWDWIQLLRNKHLISLGATQKFLPHRPHSDLPTCRVSLGLEFSSSNLESNGISGIP